MDFTIQLLQFGLWTAIIFVILRPLIKDQKDQNKELVQIIKDQMETFKEESKKEREEQKAQSEKRHEWVLKLADKIQNWFKEIKETFKDTFETHEEKDHKMIAEVTGAINKHDEHSIKYFWDLRKSFSKMAMSVWNTVLDEEQTVRLLLTEMWFVSDAKLSFIRNLLIRNWLKVRKNSIKREIKDYLITKSEDYMKNFKTFLTPVWDLSDWLQEHFKEDEFKIFLEKIYTEFFREYDNKKLSKEAIIELKINAIQSIMRHLQRNLATMLKAEMEDDLKI